MGEWVENCEKAASINLTLIQTTRVSTSDLELCNGRFRTRIHDELRVRVLRVDD